MRSTVFPPTVAVHARSAGTDDHTSPSYGGCAAGRAARRRALRALESLRRDALARRDQPPRLGEVLAAPHGQRADQPLAAQVPHREGAGLERAAQRPRGPSPRAPRRRRTPSVAQSARSDQKYGTSACSTASPSMWRAAVRPWRRRDLPVLDARRPAVQRRLLLAHVAGGHRRPRRRARSARRSAPRPVGPISSPDLRASITSGTAPAPTTTIGAAANAPARRAAPPHALVVAAREADRATRRRRTHAVRAPAAPRNQSPARAPNAALERHVLLHDAPCSACPSPSATPRARCRCTTRRHTTRSGRASASRADRLGVAERAQVVDAVELRARRRSAAARSRRWRAARCRTRPPPSSTAAPRARRCRASSRSCASAARRPSGAIEERARALSRAAQVPFEHGGRSYGGSSSRPTSSTDPANPRSRSAPRTRATPRRRRSAARRRAGQPRPTRRDANCGVIASSSPGSSTSSTSSPASITVSALGTKPAPPRSTEMIRQPSGSAMSGDLLPDRRRVRR